MTFPLKSTARLLGLVMLAACSTGAYSAPDPQKDFLRAHAREDGVVVLASGLQYRVLEAGSGAKPRKRSMVRVHYSVQLIDGTVLDSSYDRGKPEDFPANELITGWVEALQLMQEGDKWELVIPAELAYGPQGAGDVIPPNATLVFVVELIQVLK